MITDISYYTADDTVTVRQRTHSDIAPSVSDHVTVLFLSQLVNVFYRRESLCGCLQLPVY